MSTESRSTLALMSGTWHFLFLAENKRLIELEFVTDNDLETSEVLLSVLFCIKERLIIDAKLHIIR